MSISNYMNRAIESMYLQGRQAKREARAQDIQMELNKSRAKLWEVNPMTGERVVIADRCSTDKNWRGL